MPTKNHTATRRMNFNRLLKTQSPTAVAKRLGVTTSYVSQLAHGNVPFTEKTARKIEHAFSIPLGALDATEGEMPFVRVEHALFADCIRAVGTALQSAGLEQRTDKFGRLVAELYEHSAKTGEVDQAYLKRLISLLS